jgi:xanthine dehydrogenase accessory factor
MLEIYEEIARILQKGERGALATVISVEGSTPRKTGAKMLIRDDGTFIGTIGGGMLEKQVLEQAVEVISTMESRIIHVDLTETGKDKLMICGGKADIFLEPLMPRETLYLFGAGHISEKLAPMAKEIGFKLTIVDPRPNYNNFERFPGANLVLEDYTNARACLKIDEYSYIVIVTSGHNSDELCLEIALGTNAKYIGMVGSKKKVKEIKERLKQKGFSQQHLDSVHAPIGLEIGAETPAEIAVSIIAEIVMIKRQELRNQG